MKSDFKELLKMPQSCKRLKLYRFSRQKDARLYMEREPEDVSEQKPFDQLYSYFCRE